VNFLYLKFPYLKMLGGKGFVDGKTGQYCATPYSRLNDLDGMGHTAHAEYESCTTWAASRFTITRQPTGARGRTEYALSTSKRLRTRVPAREVRAIPTAVPTKVGM